MKRLAAIGAMRLSLAVKGRVEDSLYERFPSILSPDITPEEIREAEETVFDPSRCDPGYLTGISPRVDRLIELAGDNEIARTVAELCALKLLESGAWEALDLVAPGNGEGVMLVTAARCAGYYGKIDDILFACREAQRIVHFLFRTIGGEGQPFFRIPYYMDDWLLGFLSGSDEPDKAYADFAEMRDPDEDDLKIYGMEEEVAALTKRLEILGNKTGDEPGTVSVLISGERESGRYTAASAVAKSLALPLLSVDFSYLLGTEDPREVLLRLVRSSALMNRALVIRSIIRDKDTVFLIERLQRLYDEYSDMPLFLLTAPDVKLVPTLKGRYVSMRIPTGAEASLALWKGYLPRKLKKLAEPLASKMNLTAGQVRRVALALETENSVGDKADERMICRLCYEVLDDGRYENVKRVEPGFTLDDLKIDPHNRAVLEDICHQVELRHQVYDGWGLKKKYAYGRCVSVILAGPPGTGKTMTVHALAGQLGLELYKVDLSQIVDKYIGETEKRLEEVFAKAQKSNMILFFDEADAVMGKRSEVKDAKDKYANTEISFILQRIEEYDGIVLLATNNLQNIDQAFMRRIRYVLSFQMPDKETREEIWRSAFGKGVPLAGDIDYDFLADKFELSGGEIKNIVLNAVFYGASDGGEVAMRHIMKAVYRENTKLKRIAFDGDYGGYAYMLHD